MQWSIGVMIWEYLKNKNLFICRAKIIKIIKRTWWKIIIKIDKILTEIILKRFLSRPGELDICKMVWLLSIITNKIFWDSQLMKLKSLYWLTFYRVRLMTHWSYCFGLGQGSTAWYEVYGRVSCSSHCGWEQRQEEGVGSLWRGW